MTRYLLILSDSILINLGIVITFFIRYGLPLPETNFVTYKKSFIFLTLIYILVLAGFRVYKERFRSSWELFKNIFLGLSLGTLFCIAFLYTFRASWGAFPSSIFAISFFINLLLIFKFNQYILKTNRKINKRTVVLGDGRIDDIFGKKTNFNRIQTHQIKDLLNYSHLDEIVITEKITDIKNLNLLLYVKQKLKAEILFTPSVYMGLLPEKINGNSSVESFSTIFGRQSDIDEFCIRLMDILVSLTALALVALPMVLIAALIKFTSKGAIIYSQERVGKDGELFTLYKFRTMVNDAEKSIGPVMAQKDDCRITKPGGFLRSTRLDELPQLFNVLRGQMSLVGPRPERRHFVKMHKSLQGLRLSVKPGITGLAQIRNLYDLAPKHKLKYDFLYIQRRSLLLNTYIMLQTIPVLYTKKGW